MIEKWILEVDTKMLVILGCRINLNSELINGSCRKVELSTKDF